MRKQKKKHTVLKVILLIVLILLLVAAGGAFWVYQKFSDTVGEMNYRELESDKLEINQQVKENKKLKEEWQDHLKIDSENEKRFNNLYQLGNIIVPLVPISLLTACGICYLNGKDELGKNFLYAGCASLIGFEILYQGGHFIFKVW